LLIILLLRVVVARAGMLAVALVVIAHLQEHQEVHPERLKAH
jgi:hypothetical protein